MNALTTTIVRGLRARLAVGAALALALVAGLAVIHTAEPPVTVSAVTQPPDGRRLMSNAPAVVSPNRQVLDPMSRLSKADRQKLDVAVAIFRSRAFRAKTKTLDYRLAGRYDRGNHAAKREFAAGLKAGGGKVRNISSGELKKVRHIMAKLGDLPLKVRCKGQHGFRKYAHGSAALWLDSCDTSLLILVLGVVGALVGLAATIMGFSGVGAGPAIIVALVAAFFVIGALFVDYVRDGSPLDAVVFVYRLIDRWPGPGVAYAPLIVLQPQL